MEIKRIEDVDEAVKILTTWVNQSPSLIERLKQCRDSAIRWLRLETEILNSFPINGVVFTDWQEQFDRLRYRIRERTFYELQKQGIDFGFCEYFQPRWREQTENLLLNRQVSFFDDGNLCTYEKEMLTTCEGTDNYTCGSLPPEKRRIITQDILYQKAVLEATVARSRALERHYASN